MPADFEAVLTLGRRLVDELGCADSNDTLCRWMAHHIAELMTAADALTGESRRDAEAECRTAILQLWQHRAELPDGTRPFEELEPIMRAIQSLDPDARANRYFPGAWPNRSGASGKNGDTDKLIDVALTIDRSARSLVKCVLQAAASEAVDKSADWVGAAEGIDESGAPELVYGYLRPESETVAGDEKQRKLRGKIEDLRSYASLVAAFADELDIHAASLSS